MFWLFFIKANLQENTQKTNTTWFSTRKIALSKGSSLVFSVIVQALLVLHFFTTFFLPSFLINFIIFSRFITPIHFFIFFYSRTYFIIILQFIVLLFNTFSLFISYILIYPFTFLFQVMAPKAKQPVVKKDAAKAKGKLVHILFII